LWEEAWVELIVDGEIEPQAVRMTIYSQWDIASFERDEFETLEEISEYLQWTFRPWTKKWEIQTKTGEKIPIEWRSGEYQFVITQSVQVGQISSHLDAAVMVHFKEIIESSSNMPPVTQ
jgi:hypothetical protein